MAPETVVFCPDSFKGSVSAQDAARALADGWRQVRPQDVLIESPMADGGEGTLAAIASAHPAGVFHRVDVTGPDGRVTTSNWLQLEDGTAVLELAAASGLPLMQHPEPLDAHTVGLGEVMRSAIEAGARRMVIALGGSASTDGGTGILRALGFELLGADGERLPPGGRALARLVEVVRPRDLPGLDIECLVDVDVPLAGALTFAPQKGATGEELSLLEAGLLNLAVVLGGDPDAAGAGAAGGAGYGLAAALGARLSPGAPRVAGLIGLDDRLRTATRVVTGEGRLDATSFLGKAVGHVVATSGPRSCAIVAGDVAVDVALDPATAILSLTELAGSAPAALAGGMIWVEEAGRILAGMATPDGWDRHGRHDARAYARGVS